MKLYEMDGKVQSIADWAREYEIGYDVLRQRLSRGWELKKALVVPALQKGEKKNEKK